MDSIAQCMSKVAFKLSCSINCLFLTALLAFCASPSYSLAASGNDSVFELPSMFHSGEVSVGAGLVTNWSGGFNVRGEYFIYDDVSVEAGYSLMSYHGWGETVSFSYMDVAGIFHRSFGKNRKNWEWGWYGGLGFAMGRVTCTYCSSYYDAGGLFWTTGLEMKFNPKLRARIGYGVLSFGLGVDYSF